MTDHTPTPNTDAAIEFLQAFAPEGPWCLTAINPDRKGIKTKTFFPPEVDECRTWIDARNGQWNLYFSVNPVIGRLDKKASKKDIARVEWFHVDLDPRPGEDLGQERDRMLHRLTDNLPEGVPRPTAVIDSGGGYWGFWRLSKPIPIDGDLVAAEHAERYNRQLELLFDADNCHDISRIARLPGTVNLPDAKKKKRGRVPAATCIVAGTPERVHDLADFTPVPDRHNQPVTPSEGLVKIKVERQPLSEIDDLDEWDVPERIKIICAQGHHPDEGPKKGDDSRSGWLFDAVCGLVRAGVPDDVILSIITDPDYHISESVLENGRTSEAYAIRQIGRAKERAINPMLMTLNERHVAIGNYGGKFRIAEEIRDKDQGLIRLTFQTADDFRNRYANILVEVGIDDKTDLPKTVQAGHWWIKHRHRRTCDRVVFAPNREVPGAYNLWRGFACDAVPGDCSLFLAHVRENICTGDESIYDYVLNWMARAVQMPGRQGETALVLRGGRGVGKGVFVKMFGALFGRHFIHVSDPKHLVGSFNAHLRDCVLLFGDEAFYAGDKKHESTLKALITEETIMIEAKGVDAMTEPNCVHLVLASNDDWVVPVGADERRFLVLDVGAAHMQDVVYFRAIAEQMKKSGGREALLHMLMNRDLSQFEVRTVPKTAALMDQKLRSMNPLDEWLMGLLHEGKLPENPAGIPDVATSNGGMSLDKIIFMGLFQHARETVPSLRNVSDTKLGRHLKSWGCLNTQVWRVRGWKFRCCPN